MQKGPGRALGFCPLPHTCPLLAGSEHLAATLPPSFPFAPSCLCTWPRKGLLISCPCQLLPVFEPLCATVCFPGMHAPLLSPGACQSPPKRSVEAAHSSLPWHPGLHAVASRSPRQWTPFLLNRREQVRWRFPFAHPFLQQLKTGHWARGLACHGRRHLTSKWIREPEIRK